MLKGLFTLWVRTQEWTDLRVDPPPRTSWKRGVKVGSRRCLDQNWAAPQRQKTDVFLRKKRRTVELESFDSCDFLFSFAVRPLLPEHLRSNWGQKQSESRQKSCPGVLTWSWDDLGGKKKEKKAAEPTAKLLIAPLSEPGELFPPSLYFLHFICSWSLVCTQLLQAVSKVCCLMAERERERNILPSCYRSSQFSSAFTPHLRFPPLCSTPQQLSNH